MENFGDYTGKMSEKQAKKLAEHLNGGLEKQFQAIEQVMTYYSVCQATSLSQNHVLLFAPILVDLVKSSMSFEIILFCLRTITNMVDALPESGDILLKQGLLPILKQRITSVEFIDLIEQCVLCVDKLALENSRELLKEGIIEAMLLYIDFHGLSTQRKIMSNCVSITRRIPSKSYVTNIKPIIPRLHIFSKSSDSKFRELAYATIFNISNNFSNKEKILLELAPENFLDQLILDSMSKDISDLSRKYILLIFISLTSSSVDLCKQLHQKNIAKLLKNLMESHKEHLKEILQLSLRLIPRTDRANSIVTELDALERSRLLIELVNPQKISPPKQDKKIEIFRQNPVLFLKYGELLLPEFMSIFANSVDNQITFTSLTIIATLIFFSKAETLKKMLLKIPISTFIANILKDSNLILVSTGMQITRNLIAKLPDIFKTYFMREGVISELEKVSGYKASEIPGNLVENVKKEVDLFLEEQEKETEGEDSDENVNSISFYLNLLRKRSNQKVPTIKVKLPSDCKYFEDEDHTANIEHRELVGYCYLYANLMLKKYFTDHNQKKLPTIAKLNELAKSLDESNSKTELDLLKHIRNYVNEENISNYELVHSNIVDSLLKFLKCEKRRMNLFIDSFSEEATYTSKIVTSSPSTSHLKPHESSSTYLHEIIRKLLDCLTSFESFPLLKYKGFPIGMDTVLKWMVRDVTLVLIPKSEKKKKEQTEILINCLSPVHNINKYLLQSLKNKSKKKKSIETKESYFRFKSEEDEEDIEANILQIKPGSLTKTRYTFFDKKKKEIEISKPIETFNFYLNGKKIMQSQNISQALFLNSSEYEQKIHPLNCQFWNKKHIIYYEKDTNMDLIDNTTDSEKDIRSIIEEMNEETGKIIELIRLIHCHTSTTRNNITISPSHYISELLTAKIKKQLLDVFILFTGTFPTWIHRLLAHCSFLFPLELKLMYFNLSSTGITRSIAHVQQQREFQSRAKIIVEHQKVRLAREYVLESAYKLFTDMRHISSILDFQFYGEEGTGVGLTVEFFTLVSKALQRAELGIWRDKSFDKNLDRPVHSEKGLYPILIEPDKLDEQEKTRLFNIFKFIGHFTARACIDNRIIDLPFSLAFIKKIIGGSIELHDLQYIDQAIYSSLKEFTQLVKKRDNIMDDKNLNESEKESLIKKIDYKGCPLQDLFLNFTVIGYPDIELLPNGKSTILNIKNVDLYIKLQIEYFMVKGVSFQFSAFLKGFMEKLNPNYLKLFTTEELYTVLCGYEEDWSIKLLEEATKCDHGFSVSSPVIQHLFTYLSKLPLKLKKDFLLFVTGSPSLPIGGLLHMNPRLTIVCKKCSKPNQTLPSVMTCNHYLKLPNYSSYEILEAHMNKAISEGQNAFLLS